MKHGIQIFAPGVEIAAAAGSASVAIPLASSGLPPKYVRVASTDAASVRLGGAAVVATVADTLVQPGDAVILAVSGATFIAAIGAGSVQVSPMEDS